MTDDDEDRAYYEALADRLLAARQRALGQPTVSVPWDDSAALLVLVLEAAKRAEPQDEVPAEGGAPDEVPGGPGGDA